MITWDSFNLGKSVQNKFLFTNDGLPWPNPIQDDTGPIVRCPIGPPQIRPVVIQPGIEPGCL